MIQEDLDFDNLISFFLYANTPHYIYKHFRRNQSIQSLKRKYSIETLINEFLENLNNLDLKSIVTRFSILVALSFYDFKDIRTFLSEVDLEKDYFGKKIAQMILNDYVPIETCEFDYIYKKLELEKDYGGKNKAQYNLNDFLQTKSYEFKDVIDSNEYLKQNSVTTTA